MLDSASSKTGGESHIWFIQPSGLQVLPPPLSCLGFCHHSACFSELLLPNLLLRIQECFLTFSPLSWSVLLLTFTFSHLSPFLIISLPLCLHLSRDKEVTAARSIKCWHHLASHLSGSWLRGRGRKRRREMRWGVKVRVILSRSSRSHTWSCFHHFRRRYTDFISRITTFNITKQNAHFYQKMLP